MGNPQLRTLPSAFCSTMPSSPNSARRRQEKIITPTSAGYLEHVVSLMEVVVRIVDRYPAIDPDLC